MFPSTGNISSLACPTVALTPRIGHISAAYCIQFWSSHKLFYFMPGLASALQSPPLALFISIAIVKLQNLYALNCDPLLFETLLHLLLALGLQGPEKVFSFRFILLLFFALKSTLCACYFSFSRLHFLIPLYWQNSCGFVEIL